ncbi:MAG: helix-turn-helix domain-containing protein [Paludibacteraceae bacterium]|nr:helix-turn-helix domain-containing protein [Paludibacteraceae bacterium]
MKRELLPSQIRILQTLGEQIRYARLRRDLTTVQIAERAGISRSTLVRIEKGDEGVALGQYFRVLIALGLASDITLVAKDDELGRKLQDAKLEVRKRASKK